MLTQSAPTRDLSALELTAYEFLERHTNSHAGLASEGYAAIRTAELFDLQEAQGVCGTLFEIGVRLLANTSPSLMRSGVGSSERVIGLDTFQYLPEEAVRQHSRRGAGRTADLGSHLGHDHRLQRHRGPDVAPAPESRASSSASTASHECDDVFWDFSLAEQVLSPDGAIAADDFPNPLTLGVGEGIHRFFASPRNLAPFAYTANKLFLCRPAKAEMYRAAFERFVLDDMIECAERALPRNAHTHGRHHVEQPLWGRPVLDPMSASRRSGSPDVQRRALVHWEVPMPHPGEPGGGRRRGGSAMRPGRP